MAAVCSAPCAMNDWARANHERLAGLDGSIGLTVIDLIPLECWRLVELARGPTAL